MPSNTVSTAIPALVFAKPVWLITSLMISSLITAASAVFPILRQRLDADGSARLTVIGPKGAKAVLQEEFPVTLRSLTISSSVVKRDRVRITRETNPLPIQPVEPTH